MSDNFYRAFEERYRGSRDLIKGRLRAYAPFIAQLATLYPAARALDLGCGRGEWLELMDEAGFAAHGVDLDEGMLAACRERGLDVETADALTVLRALPDASVALVSAFHLVEHLPFEDAQTLIAQARRVLLPGGLIILETPNPENLIVGTSNFYLDPSHLKPIPPMLLDFMVSFAGFARNAVVRLQGEASEPEHDPITLTQLLEGVSFDYAIVAQHDGTPEQLAPFDAAFAADYGVALDVMAQRYDQSQARQYEALAAASQHRPDLDAVLAHVQGAVAALDQQGAATSVAIAEIDRGLSALDHQALRQGESLAALNEGVRHFTGHIDQRLLALEAAAVDLGTVRAENAALTERVRTLEQASEHLLGTTLPQQLQHLNDTAEAVKFLQQNMERQLRDEERILAQLTAIEERAGVAERRGASAPERLTQLESRLLDALTETAKARQLAAELALRIELDETGANALRQLAEERQAQLGQLERHLADVMASTSWRITWPVRKVGGWMRTLRERRVRATVRRGLAGILTPLRTPGGGWLGKLARRAKQNESLRRIVLPILARYPRLNAHLANVIRNPYGVHMERPSGDITHPDWPGLLPAEYLNMSPSSRKVLLDLARAGQNKPPHP